MRKNSAWGKWGAVLLVACSLWGASQAWGNYSTNNGIVWTYTVSDGQATICRNWGGPWDPSVPTIPVQTSGAIAIPSSLDGYPVTTIGSEAFRGCYNLTSVAIPNSVTNIERYAFSGCFGLTTVTLPDSVTIIPTNMFGGCSNLTSVVIPDGVTVIQHGAFWGCHRLEDVQIPNSVTAIEWYAFCGCRALTSVTIPDSVTKIESRVFAYSGLTSVTIPESVWLICDHSFAYCPGLTNVTIPESVRFLDERTFIGCSNLVSVTILGNVTNDCTTGGPFVDCPKLETIVLGDKMTKIGNGMFYGCSHLTSMEIPEGVTSIGKEAFAYCTGLANVTIPKSVTSIGENAFWNCSSLASVTIPESVTSIWGRTFWECSGLTNVTILGNVTTTNKWGWYSPFEGSTNIETVVLGNKVSTIGDYMFQGLSKLTNITLPDSVTSIGLYAFSGCYGLPSIAIPPNVTNIEGGAFAGCTNLTAVHISDLEAWCGIKFSNYEANPLYYAHRLYLNGEEVMDLVIPESVTRIGDCSFCKATNLTSLTLHDHVTDIGEWAFYYCNGLTELELPKSLISIGGYAFCVCDGLTELRIPDSVTEIGKYSLGCSNMETLYVPASWKTKYVEGHFWRTYAGVPKGCKVVYGEEKQARAENVRAVQRPKTTLVDVYYDLVDGESKKRYEVGLSVASGAEGAPVSRVTGDVGEVKPGSNRHIVWNAGADWPDREEEGVVATVTAPGGDASSPPFKLDTCKPVVVQDVTSAYCSGEYGGYGGRRATFLGGVDCNVEFTIRTETHNGATVNHYLVNGKRQDNAVFTFNVGDPLPGGGRLKVIAVDGEGNQSNPFPANFDVAEIPPMWNVAGQAGAWVAAHPRPDEGRVVYRASAFRGLSLFEALSDVAEIAGEDFPLDFFPTAKLYQSVDSGTGQYREGADVGGKHDTAGAPDRFGILGGLEISLGLTGGTIYDYDPLRRSWFQTSRDLGFQLGGSWRVRQRLPEFPLLYGEIGMVGSGEFLARERDGLWECDISLDPLVALRATLGLGADVVAAAEVSGQGGIVLDARVPGGLDYVGLQGKFEWRAVLLTFERSGIWWEANHPIYGSRGRTHEANPAWRAASGDDGFRPLARDYGKAGGRRGAARAVEGNPAVLAEDGYPAPQPSLAANGFRDALVYLRDNGERSDANRTELMYRSAYSSYWGTFGTWSDEEPVWDDGTADFMPKVALLANGTALAAWANEGRVLGEGATFGEACAALEIAVGVRDASTGAWVCTNLTDDAALDCVPVLKAEEDGTAAVGWVRNADGEYVGSAESPSDLCAAFRRGGEWGAAAVAVEGAGAVLSHDLAWDGERAALVWAVDADGNLATGGDTEIRATLFENGAWGTPVRLSGAASGAMSPHAWFLGDGTLHAVWTEDGTLFAANGLAEGCGAPVAGAEAVSVPPGYRLLPATATNAVLAWTETPPEGSGRAAGDLVAVSYSPETGLLPGGEATLLATEDLERNVSGAVGSDGTLRLAYESVAVGADGKCGAVDLAVYRKTWGGDVKASPEGCSFAEALAVGETNRLVVKVENAGPGDAKWIAWQIWDGDGAELVASGTVDVPAFSCVPVSAEWTPEEGLENLAFIVEVGTNTFVWSPEAGGPALSFRDAQAVKATETLRLLSARVRNDGLAPLAAGAVAEFRRGDAGGELLGTVTLGAVGSGDAGECAVGIAWDMAGLTFTSAWERVTIALPGVPGAPSVSVWAATPLDTDGDGLPDAEEEALGTDPAKPDTNGDGISDYDHVYVWFTDPLAGMDGEWTAETPVPVPHEWLAGFGLGGGTPEGCEKAAAAIAANGVNAVWECYVAGIDPTDASAKFEAELVFEDGQWKAKPKGGEKEGRTYRVKGKREMSDGEEWTDVTDVENAEEDGWRFFRVGVGME